MSLRERPRAFETCISQRSWPNISGSGRKTILKLIYIGDDLAYLLDAPANFLKLVYQMGVTATTSKLKDWNGAARATATYTYKLQNLKLIYWNPTILETNLLESTAYASMRSSEVGMASAPA